MNNTIRLFVIPALLGLLAVSGCRRAVATTTEVVATQAKALPAAPNDAAWETVPEHPAKLLLQDLVEPRLMQASTTEVRVRAITNGTEVAFRLEWDDKTKNDLPGPARFMDACAVQVPTKLEANVPDPQMGGQGKTVEVTYWRADWQASVDGRPDSLKQIYPNASVDHYPFEAQSLEKGSAAQNEMATRYAPAQALGNRRVGPRAAPVEDLIADGPGTLSPAPPAGSKGKGVKSDNGWSVVLTRKLPNGLTPGGRTQIACAVWEGAQQETGARKMRAGYFRSTGDGNPNDGTHNTFFQALPTPRIYARFPFYNLMNNEDAFAQLRLKPHAKLALRADVHQLRLSNANDQWYLGGGAFQPQTFGYTGRPSNGRKTLGALVDLSADYTLTPTTTLTFYVGGVRGGGVAKSIYPQGSNARFIYLELAKRF